MTSQTKSEQENNVIHILVRIKIKLPEGGLVEAVGGWPLLPTFPFLPVVPSSWH